MAPPTISPYQLVTCPYNAAHQVEHRKLHTHIEKCKKQYPSKKRCPFDSTHIVDEEKLDHHVKNCSKRSILDNQIYVMDDQQRPQVTVQPPSLPVNYGTTENWDDDNYSTYDPSLQLNKSNIITKIKGATPSERRQFRCERVKKYGAGESGSSS